MGDKVNLVIAGADYAYLHMLEEQISQSGFFDRIHTFSKSMLLKEFLQKNEAGVILLDEALYDSDLNVTPVPVKILLTGNKESRPPEGWKAVYKVQKVRNLLQEVSLLCAGEGDIKKVDPPPRTSMTKFVTFFAPVGGSGKTSLALACSALFIQNDKKHVFYLNAEKYASFRTYFTTEWHHQDLSDVIKALQEDGPVAYKIKTARVTERVSRNDEKPNQKIDFFFPPESGLQLTQLEERHITRLMKELAALQEYDLVVIDLDGGLSPAHMRFLVESDVIVMPLLAGTLPVEKVFSFYEMWRNRYRAYIAKEKIIPLWNKRYDGDENERKRSLTDKGALPEELELKLSISYMHNLIYTERVFQLRDAFDRYADELLDEIRRKLGW